MCGSHIGVNVKDVSINRLPRAMLIRCVPPRSALEGVPSVVVGRRGNLAVLVLGKVRLVTLLFGLFRRFLGVDQTVASCTLQL